ncbi:hypothetical protein [Fulvivirga lutimaris]|uniref:hypothetical protein n=1 Tax=Fulvivirga lutimaris TaxID=1819566 RepID=UPI0012BB9435|nr:hypothetical protein [Fulvivirga lutimaris]MTI40044.1 hypothetical protein [Fulvivirga lutimaris]
MKYLAIIFFIFSCNFANSQSVSLDAEIITFDGDTLNNKIKIWVNIFNKELIRENSFYRKLSVINGEGIKKIKTKEISHLSFIDPKGMERKFISDFHMDPISSKKGTLYEEHVNGCVNWYTMFSTNTYDQSVVRTDYFWRKDEGEVYSSGPFGSLKKRIAKFLFEDEESWAQKINAIESIDEVKIILENYNVECSR